jgi:pyrroloquinoline quinone (PQQ) biosynthesis protein C
MRRTHHALEGFSPESSKKDCKPISYFNINDPSPMRIKFSFLPFSSYEENPV